MTTPSCWPTYLDHLWAKSSDKGAGGKPETLAQHTWDVLARLAEQARLRPDLPQALGMPRLWHVVAWAAFLHDFGKAAAGFQTMLRTKGKKWDNRHEVLSLAFVDWVAGGLDAEEQGWLVAAIVSHHKDASEMAGLYPPPRPGDDSDEDQAVELVAELAPKDIGLLWRWLSECGTSWLSQLGCAPLPPLPPAQAAVGQVTRDGPRRIYHWLDVYDRFVGKIENARDTSLRVRSIAVRGAIINADHSASAHAGDMPRVQFNAETVYSGSKVEPAKLFPHQRAAAAVSGSALLTAPTGSGKTEAALLWAAHQAQRPHGLPRLFYTLPYQASMNAMKLRLEETFGKDTEVGLIHGRGLFALYRLLLERDYDAAKAAQQARWMRNLGQLNYQPVRVFSPYQMLKGMYRLKGYEALLTDYHNAAFIFDEIHAYEVKRLAMILKTMQYLSQNYSARFLVMSATFPTLIKTWLREALNNPQELEASPELFAAFRRHHLALLDGELLTPENLERIVSDTRSGKSVLVVANKVRRAQELYDLIGQALKPDGIEVVLLHGRFNMRHRSAKEARIREATGSKTDDRLRKPIVVVATQAIEVSLDIDLDTIYTDPAPLEALVQRFGRVNRRRKQRDLAPVYVCREPRDNKPIYDEELVLRTLAILERENNRPIDESAIGGWLDEIYSGEVAARWQDEFNRAADDFEATCVRPLRAFEAADDQLEKEFYDAFDSIEVLPEVSYDEYASLKQTDPILAGELLVPLRWGQYLALCNRGQAYAREKGEPALVKAPYDEDRGLEV